MNTVDTKTAEALKATIDMLVEQRDHEKACVEQRDREIARLRNIAKRARAEYVKDQDAEAVAAEMFTILCEVGE